MKTGVTLSGCDIGGISAYQVLRLLKENGLSISMISASGTPALGALCFAMGVSPEEYDILAETFLEDLKREDLDTALANFSGQIGRCRSDIHYPLAIGAVNLSDGKSVVFTNAFQYQSGNLLTYPFEDSYDMLSATFSLCEGLAAYPFRGDRLCDYTVCHGCPFFPLRLTGAGKILSVSFCPTYPESPYEALVAQRIEASAKAADLHLGIGFFRERGLLKDYNQVSIGAVQNCIHSNDWNLLF